jgi:hypothetical protein
VPNPFVATWDTFPDGLSCAVCDKDLSGQMVYPSKADMVIDGDLPVYFFVCEDDQGKIPTDAPIEEMRTDMEALAMFTREGML